MKAHHQRQLFRDIEAFGEVLQVGSTLAIHLQDSVVSWAINIDGNMAAKQKTIAWRAGRREVCMVAR